MIFSGNFVDYWDILLGHEYWDILLGLIIGTFGRRPKNMYTIIGTNYWDIWHVAKKNYWGGAIISTHG